MKAKTDLLTNDDTARALMALVNDLSQLTETTERVRIQIQSLAARHGVSLPRPLSP